MSQCYIYNYFCIFSIIIKIILFIVYVDNYYCLIIYWSFFYYSHHVALTVKKKKKRNNSRKSVWSMHLQSAFLGRYSQMCASIGHMQQVGAAFEERQYSSPRGETIFPFIGMSGNYFYFADWWKKKVFLDEARFRNSHR